MRVGKLVFALVALAVVLVSTPVLAQAARPNAGQLLQQTAPALPPPSAGQNQGVEQPAAPSVRQRAASTATIPVKSIRFVGNTHIGSDTLRRAVPQIDQIQGKSATLAQLYATADAVTRYYRQQGYFVAMAYVPRQTVSGGIVTIAVLEGQLDQTRVGRDGGYASEMLQRYANEALCGHLDGCPGMTLTRENADRAVGLVSNLPGVASASATLAPGATVGSSDYTLDAVPGPAVSGALGVDDYGNEYTGRIRETGDLHWNNPLGIGDLFTADVALSGLSGMDGGRGAMNGVVDYSLPVGYDGWRAGTNYTRLIYRLGAPFNATDAYGSGNEFNTYATYPVFVYPNDNLSVRVSYGVKWLTDNVLQDTFLTTDQTGTIGVNGDYIDTLGGGGLTQYGLTLTHGYISYGSGPLPTGTPDAAGNYDKLNLNVSRDQTVAYLAQETQRLSLYGVLQGQWSDANLDSVEKLSLGGPGGVRGYPVGEATGDEGLIATVELHDSFVVPELGGDNLTVSVFHDDGWLKINHNLWAGYQGPAHRRLGSTGLGVDLLSQNRYDVKAMWAIRDQGGETDTSTPDHDNWLWFQAEIFL